MDIKPGSHKEHAISSRNQYSFEYLWLTTTTIRDDYSRPVAPPIVLLISSLNVLAVGLCFSVFVVKWFYLHPSCIFNLK